MKYVSGLRCINCTREYDPTEVEYTCAECGIKGILDLIYDYPRIKRVFTRDTLARRSRLDQWRYVEVLPVVETDFPPLHVGWTPIYTTSILARHLNVRELYVKDEGRNPTGSLKDRATAVGLMKAFENKKEVVACASTGNAASSLAGFAAAGGLKSVIFVPKATPEPKIAQLLIYGANVLTVKGTYDQAYSLCQEACARWGWYNRNCAINPYLIEGKKTVGYEIVEQLEWRVPDWVVFSVGDGCTIAGAWKAFKEMRDLGFIDKTPRMLGVQGVGADPIVEAFRRRTDPQAIIPRTVADSIAVGQPRNWRKVLTAIEESKGFMLSVSDTEILDSMKLVAGTTGVFGEPAGVAGIAALKKAIERELLGTDSRILVVVTATGLKDTRAVMQIAGRPISVEPDLGAVSCALENGGLV